MAYADTNIHLQIETNTGTIYNQNIDVAPCDNEGIMEITAYCALTQSGITSDWSGFWINSINEVSNNAGNNGIYWMWLANLNINNPYSDFICHQDAPSGCSAKQYILNTNDKILFYYNINPLNISVDNTNPTVGNNITIKVTELGLDGWTSVWNKATGGKIVVNSNIYDLDSNGEYSLPITDINQIIIKAQKDNFIDSKEIVINPKPIPAPEPAPAPRRSGGGPIFLINPISNIQKAKFDINKGFEFLYSQQEENGSFGEDLYTDWTALSLSTTTSFKNQNIKLQKYLQTINTKDYGLTDYERHSIALMAQGINPYNVNNKNYIEKIISSFDGKQFGNIKEDNDDIFALIVLQNAGYKKDEEIIKNTINFILSKQKENGSWDESIDMTGAGIGALSYFNQDEKVKNSLIKAREFLKQNQKDTGGWANISSTSWAIEGILALSEKPEDWIKNNNTPIDYLSINQNIDGGIKNLPAQTGEYLQNQIWETAYSLTALSGKTWNQIMQKFEKPKEKIGQQENQKTITKIIAKKNLQETKKINIQNKENKKQTSENITKENVATVIKSTNNTTTKGIETKKNSWFKRFFTKIFSF